MRRYTTDKWSVIDRYREQEILFYSWDDPRDVLTLPGHKSDLRILILEKKPDGFFSILVAMTAMPREKEYHFKVSPEGLSDFLKKYKHPKGLSEEVIADIEKTVSSNSQTEEESSFMREETVSSNPQTEEESSFMREETVSSNPQTEEGSSFMSRRFFNWSSCDKDEKVTEPPSPSTTNSPRVSGH